MFLEHDSFGWETFDSNPNFDIPIGFAGGIVDLTSGLVRFGYRDYEPNTGRWTAKDPIFFKGGQGNLYQYVQNNPVNFKDLYGLFQIGTVGNIGGFDFSAVWYDSNRGWFPAQPMDIRVSTNILGAALTIRTDNNKSPCDKLYSNTSLETTLGVNRFLGISYDPAMTHTTYNIGAGIGTPILSFSGSVEGFAQGVGNVINNVVNVLR